MKVRPNFDSLLVQPVKIENITPQGVHLSVNNSEDDSDVKMILARVIEVGPYSRPDPSGAEPFKFEKGQYITLPSKASVFPLKYSPIALVSKSEQLPEQMFCRMSQVLAIVEAEDGEVFPDGTLPNMKLVTA